MPRSAIVVFDKDRLSEYVKIFGGKQSAFARMCGIDGSVFSRILRRGTCCVEELARVADGVGVDFDALLSDIAIFKNKPQEYRIRAKLSPRELGEKAGVSTETIYALESGRDCFCFPAACLSRALGISMGKYLGFED